MHILVTGARGFVGRNLCAQLRNIQEGKARGYNIDVAEVMAYDLDSTPEDLDQYCQRADFVFNLAGVNRPKTQEEFMAGNFGFASTLLDTLKRHHNTCPVMLSSSIQASLEGRYAGSEYGRSKLAGEELFLRYGRETGARVLVYRFPNLFGKWCRPNYNSAVATFCHNTAHGLPLTVSDPTVELHLLYIDDLVDEMLLALQGREHREGPYCVCPVTHRATLGHIVELLSQFKSQRETLLLPDLTPGSFSKKLYSTYLSYLPREGAIYTPVTHADQRGSFTELIRTAQAGQMSVNVSLPGVTKGQHWHHTKTEKFIVVSGRARIEQRREGSDEVFAYEVSGQRPQVVDMLPGYTHNITNLSPTEPLVTLMWANETFDPARPDTFSDPV